MITEYGKQLAEEHVDWWLASVRPLLIANFIHGFKHGQKEAWDEVNEMERPAREEYLKTQRIKNRKRP